MVRKDTFDMTDKYFVKILGALGRGKGHHVENEIFINHSDGLTVCIYR